MIMIKCPKCSSEDLHVYDNKGCIKDGIIIEETECLNCNHVFIVSAKLLKVEIE